ncbi:MAG: PQQ-binding-like beta-propeller repeat protein, partial [Planctomycetota bacterium]
MNRATQFFFLFIPYAFVVSITKSPAADPSGQWRGFGGPQHRFKLESDLRISQPTSVAERTVGEGRSGVVVDQKHCYVTALKTHSSDSTPQETVMALDRETLKTVWQHDYEVKALEDQETFGGNRRSPQSTPQIIRTSEGDRLVTLGFSGELRAFHCDSGELCWQKNLVDDFEATPVQFGFTASPIEVDGQLIVLTGGPSTAESDGASAGLLSLSPLDGRVVWSVACGEASYATPVVADWSGQRQIVFLNRNRVMSVSLDGELLWQRPLPESGLTNVPTPLPCDDGLILSGQGFQGTEKWSIQKQDGAWEISEKWRSDEQFFYCNWCLDDGKLIGCTGNLLVAIDERDGSTLGKWRGYTDANLSMIGDAIFVLEGRGNLQRLKWHEQGLEIAGSWSIGKGRYWTPVSWANGRAYLRRADQLVSVGWNANGNSALVSDAKRIGRVLA